MSRVIRRPKQSPPATPGELLEREFRLGRGVKAFAKHLGLERNRLRDILRGCRRITPDTAMRLSKVLDTTPEFWLNAQAATDQWRTAQAPRR
jgi:addiction module HigA family antidote